MYITGSCFEAKKKSLETMIDNETSRSERKARRERETQSWGGEKIHITWDSPGTIRRSDI